MVSADDVPARIPGARSEIYKTIEGSELRIFIFEPEGHSADAAAPAIVFFFGGGWREGLPDQFEPQCRILASRGMVAMTADYRVSSRQGTQARHCVEDAKSAVRWVRTHADRLGIDPERIAAGGGSAGGHIAACTAMIDGFESEGEDLEISCVPNALVLFNPPVSLGGRQLPEAERNALEERMGTDPVNLSPLHHVRADLPPTILFYGTADELARGGETMHERMLEEGNTCELKLYEGYDHGFYNRGRHENVPFRQTMRDVVVFLDGLGWVEARRMR
jgi:acetyl esterase/lipase